MPKKYITILLIAIVLAASVLVFLLFSNKEDSEPLEPTLSHPSEIIDAKTLTTSENLKEISISDNVVLVASSPLNYQSEKENSFTSLYIKDKESGKLKLIQKSDYQLSFNSFGGKAYFESNNKTYFVIYEFTSLADFNGKKVEKRNKGYVYSLDDKGIVRSLYETKYLFDSASYDNGTFNLYEKSLKDDVNMFPSFLKPYDSIKMTFNGEKFVEKNRSYVEPIKNLKKQ